jgi:acyl carrier protein
MCFATMSEQSETLAKVRAVVARIAKQAAADFSNDAHIFRELGVESTAALDLLLSIEEEFGISLSDDAFAQAQTVTEICALVELVEKERA